MKAVVRVLDDEPRSLAARFLLAVVSVAATAGALLGIMESYVY